MLPDDESKAKYESLMRVEDRIRREEFAALCQCTMADCMKSHGYSSFPVEPKGNRHERRKAYALARKS